VTSEAATAGICIGTDNLSEPPKTPTLHQDSEVEEEKNVEGVPLPSRLGSLREHHLPEESGRNRDQKPF